MSIADALTQTFVTRPQSGYADPYATESYGTVVSDETRNGHTLKIRYDAVCRDFMAEVDGEHVGSFYGTLRQAYDVASREITYLIEQAARYGQYEESDMAATEGTYTIDPLIEQAAQHGQYVNPAPSTAQQLIEFESSLQVAADQKETAYQAHQKAAESLERIESQIMKEICDATGPDGKKLYSNDKLRDAALIEWRMGAGYDFCADVQAIADSYRIARQNYDLALEHVKTYRALLEYQRAEIERQTEQAKAERARLELEAAKLNRDTALGIPF